MQLPLRIDPAAGMGLQAQVTDQIRQLILDGRLTPGARMPATRQLALDLGVSRNTVMGAFERLAAEGLIEAREPTGTFVAGRIVAEGPALLPLPEA
ncbi:MAG: winged helix-turn-helix domain-containing protein, partial [Comamonas sp.]